MGDPSSEDPVVRQELAITQVRLAELYRVDGRTDDGVRLFEQALAMYQALGTLDPQRVEYRCGGARCLVGLARSSLQVGKADETERLWHRARDLYGSAGIGLETSSESKEACAQSTMVWGSAIVCSGDSSRPNGRGGKRLTTQPNFSSSLQHPQL